MKQNENWKTIVNPKTKEILKCGYHLLEQLNVKNQYHNGIDYETLTKIVSGFKLNYGYQKCNTSSIINKKRLHNPIHYNYLYSHNHNLCLIYDSITKVVITLFHLDTSYYTDSISRKWYVPTH